MSTEATFAPHASVLAGEKPIAHGRDGTVARVAAPAWREPKGAAFAITVEEVSSIVTVALVSILALATFGSMIGPF